MKSADLAARAAHLEIDVVANDERPAVRVLVVGDEVRLYRDRQGSVAELRDQLWRLVEEHAREIMAKVAVLAGDGWDASSAVVVGWTLKGRGIRTIFYESAGGRVICIGHHL